MLVTEPYVEQAKVWLEKAYKLGGRKQFKLMALQDQDLEPLWKEMRQAQAENTIRKQ